MADIIYVHGAGATAHSFTWLKSQLPLHEAHYFNYDIDESTESCLDRLTTMIVQQIRPVVLIGHSMGGILCRAAASRVGNITRIITLCSPFGGMVQADFLALFHSTPIFRDLRTYSPFLRVLRSSPMIIPHRAIVATRGLPYMNEANDGVTTVESQTALTGPSYVKIALNHFEVLLSTAVARNLIEFLLEDHPTHDERAVKNDR